MRKKVGVMVLVLCSMLFITGFAQEQIYYRASIFKDGKAGFIDDNGNELTEFIYDWAHLAISPYFTEGLACVSKDGKWGFVDVYGNEAIPFVYENGIAYGGWIYEFSEGLSAVCKDEKWGYIDKSNNAIIPFVYDYATNFTDGFAYVIIQNGTYENSYKDEISAVINTKGEVVKFLSEYDSYISDNIHKILIKKGDKFGYLNENWEEVFLPELQGMDIELNAVSGYINGELDFIWSSNTISDGYVSWYVTGTMDINGNEILPCIYDYNLFGVSNGYCILNERTTAIAGKTGLIDRTGQFILPCIYDSLDFMSEDGIVMASKDGISFYIDVKNNCSVIQSNYEAYGTFTEGLGKVRGSDGKYGFIDKSGNLIISCEYDYCSDFYGGICEVQKKGKWGFIRTDGSICVPLEYDSVGTMYDGIAAVEKDGKWGYVGLLNGVATEIIECTYEQEYAPGHFCKVVIENLAISATDISVSEQIKISVKCAADNYSGKIFGALYGDNGELVNIKCYNAQSNITVSFDSGVMGDYVKIMWWDGEEGLEPKSDYEIVNLSH